MTNGLHLIAAHEMRMNFLLRVKVVAECKSTFIPALTLMWGRLCARESRDVPEKGKAACCLRFPWLTCT